MHIITKLIINDFRSIAFAELDIASSFLPIVGKNNSGKSNILRALNLFFNNETEPGRLLNIYEDFHNPSRKKKKEISITVDFNLPDSFNFQKTIRIALENTLSRHFQIKKIWSIPESPFEKGAKLKIQYKKDSGEFIDADQDVEYRIRQFLALIRFRYLPNHIHPSEVLRLEQSSIQTELLAKLRRSKKVSQEVQENIFKELGSLSKEFIRPIADEFQSTDIEIESIDLSTPTDMAELLFSFAPRLQVREGESLNALLHGSGAQSLLTILILRYLDSRFSSRFGWHQATIWAIEEPESFLHQDLEHKVADLLSKTGNIASYRFQVFCTTHSDVFVRHSSEGVLCTLKSSKTDTIIKKSRELTGEAARLGISPYVPPIIFGAPKPLLIVEGPSDKILTEYAYAALKIPCPWEIQDTISITSNELSGIEGLKTYLRVNKGVIESRALKAPIYVLIDWNENERQIKEFKSLLSVHLTSDAYRWRKPLANPELDDTFTGIERFLSTQSILEANQKGLLIARRPVKGDYPLSCNKASIKKVELAKFIALREKPEDVSYFKRELESLNNQLAEGQHRLLQYERGALFLA